MKKRVFFFSFKTENKSRGIRGFNRNYFIKIKINVPITTKIIHTMFNTKIKKSFFFFFDIYIFFQASKQYVIISFFLNRPFLSIIAFDILLVSKNSRNAQSKPDIFVFLDSLEGFNYQINSIIKIATTSYFKPINNDIMNIPTCIIKFLIIFKFS